MDRFVRRENVKHYRELLKTLNEKLSASGS